MNLLQQLSRMFHKNGLSLISVLIACSALSYNAWRYEQSEQNQNVRVAAFNVLKELTSLQLLSDHAFYENNQIQGSVLRGWAHVVLIEDMGQLLPLDVQQKSTALKAVWQHEFSTFYESKRSNERITESIEVTRKHVLNALANLE